MFSKSSKNTAKQASKQPAAPAVKPVAPSIISKDLRIIGDLNCDGEIQVDGSIDGDIRTKVLLVGETAHIKGEIIADTVRVHGTINGQVKAQAVSLAATAHVVGDILHEDLSIDKGAYLEGHCRRFADNQRGEDSKINLLSSDTPAGSLPPPSTEAEETAEGKEDKKAKAKG